MKFTRRHDLDPQTRIEIVKHVWLHQGIYGKMTQIEPNVFDNFDTALRMSERCTRVPAEMCKWG